jgi:G3E family GTPase
MPIPLVLITGFLGSGKTTLLNNILRNSGGRKTGVIVNEFGSVNIDALRIAASGALPGEVVELNNGQIFCSCLSGSFVESVLAFADKPIDLLLVECSGLSRPAPLDLLVREIEKGSGGRIRYRGMVCVADAETFGSLSQAAAAVTEQAARSGVILLNKADLVTEAEADAVAMELAAINPTARIIGTSFCAIDDDILSLIPGEGEKGPGHGPSACAPRGSTARPESLFLTADDPVEEEALRAFLVRIAGSAYRVKGFISMPGGNRSIDCVGDHVAMERWTAEIGTPGLVVILRHGASADAVREAGESRRDAAAGRGR